METKETQVCCCGGKDRLAKVDEILARFAGVKGALIPVLQEAQHAYGFLPKDVISHIAKSLKIPTSAVYGVVTFYSQFHMNPRGRNIIRVCQGTACHVRGSDMILDAISRTTGIEPGETSGDGKFSLERVACFGSCALAPVVVLDDKVYGRMTAAKTKKIIEDKE